MLKLILNLNRTMVFHIYDESWIFGDKLMTRKCHELGINLQDRVN